MRLWTLLLWLLIAVAGYAVDTALSSAELDKLAYSLVTAREEPSAVSIFLPTFGYGRQEEIQFVVVAVPYTPSDTNPSLLSSLVTALADRDWNKAAQLLSNFRNVYLPYETFKIKLIFVFFVRTKTLIDLGVESIQQIASDQGVGQNEKDIQEMWPVYYTSAIFQIMSANMEKNNVLEKINNWKNQYKINIIDVRIEDVEKNEKEIIADGIKYRIANVKRVISVKTNKFSLDNIVIIQYSQLDTIYLNEKMKETTCVAKIMYHAEEIGKKYDELSGDIYNNAINLIKFNVLPNINQLQMIFTSSQEKLSDFSTELNKTIIQHFEEKIKPVPSKLSWSKLIEKTDVGYQFCDLDDVTERYKGILESEMSDLDSSLQSYIDNIATMLNYGIVKWNNLLLESFSDALISSINEKEIAQQISNSMEFANNEFVNNVIKGVSQEVVTCAVEYAKSLAKSSANKFVTSVPFAGWAYAIGNGIVGALQNIIYVNGEVSVENKIYNRFNNMLYNVSSPNICSPGVEIRTVAGTSFKSGPSLTEAIFASIKGFSSALFNLFTSSEALDLIPIVREVDVPPDNYYFMVSSQPGLYAITIKLDVKSLIGNIKSQIKDNIKKHLIMSQLAIVFKCKDNLETCNKGSELFNKVVDVIKMNIDANLLGKAEFSNIFNKQVKENYNIDDNGRTEVAVYVVSFSPYAYGVKSYFDGSTSKFYYKYSFVYDWFSFFRPIIYDAFGIVRSMSTCENTQSSGGQSSSSTSGSASVEGLMSEACNKVLNNAIDSVIKSVISQANNYISSELENLKINAPSCSVAGFIAVGANALIDELKQTLENRIADIIKNPIEKKIFDFCKEIKNTVRSRFSSLLGGASFLVNVYGAGVGEGNDPISLGCSLRRSLGYLASPLLGVVEDYSYLPSYLLSRISISPPVTTVVKKCYAVVTSPYFVYPQSITIARENLPELLLKYSEDIASIKDQNTNLGESLFIVLAKYPIIMEVTAYIGNVPFGRFIIKLALTKGNGVYCITLKGPNDNVLLNWACFRDLQTFFRSAEYQTYVKYMDGTYSFNYESSYKIFIYKIEIRLLSSPIDQILQDNDFSTYIMPKLASLMMDRRGVNLTYLGGVNTYFTAFKVYPAIAVWERLDDLNAYYMVIPYSAPARELFVLGTVGDYVIYDGEPKRSDNKPFLYVDLVEGSTR